MSSQLCATASPVKAMICCLVVSFLLVITNIHQVVMVIFNVQVKESHAV